MSYEFPKHSPTVNEFLTATLKVVELEYEYVVGLVGQNEILSDIDQKKMTSTAMAILEQTGPAAKLEMSATDELALAHLELVATTVGMIQGYDVTYISNDKMTLDQSPKNENGSIVITSLEVFLSPEGLTVKKYQRTARTGQETIKHSLGVSLEDVTIIDLFVQKITALT